jgi:hypothetical protein
VRKQTKIRLAAVFAVAALAAFAIGSVARATSGSDSFNPTVLVTASMVSSGANPDVATVRDTINETMSVTNLSSAKQYVRIFQGSNMPIGPSPTKDQLKLLGPGQTWSWKAHTKVKKGTPLGVYTISVAGLGSGVLDPSATSASITIADSSIADDGLDADAATETVQG